MNENNIYEDFINCITDLNNLTSNILNNKLNIKNEINNILKNKKLNKLNDLYFFKIETNNITNNIDKLYLLLNNLDFYNEKHKIDQIKTFEKNQKIIRNFLPLILYNEILNK